MSDKQLQAQRIIEERKRLLAEKVKQQQEQQRLEAERQAAEKKKKELEKWRKLKGLEDKPKKKKVDVAIATEEAPAPLPEVLKAEAGEDLQKKEAGLPTIERAESDWNPLELTYSTEVMQGYCSKPEDFEDPVDELNRICEDSINSRAFVREDEVSSDDSAAFEREADDYVEDFESLSDSLEEDAEPVRRVNTKPNLLTESLQFDIQSEMDRIQTFEKAKQAEQSKYKETVLQRLLHNFDKLGEDPGNAETPTMEPDSPVHKHTVEARSVDTGSSFESDVNARALSDESAEASESSDFERAEEDLQPVNTCMLTQMETEWEARETATFQPVQESAAFSVRASANFAAVKASREFKNVKSSVEHPDVKVSANFPGINSTSKFSDIKEPAFPVVKASADYIEEPPLNEAEVFKHYEYHDVEPEEAYSPETISEPKGAFLMVGEENSDDRYERARKKKLQLLAERRLGRKQSKEHTPEMVLETPTRREPQKAPAIPVEECKSVKREDLSEKYRRHKKLPQLVYQKPSNRKLIQNAITQVCCAGAPNTLLREEVLKALESKPSALNFIIVFKGNLGRRDLKALYELEEDSVRKVFGPANCPETLTPSDVKSYFRYDSGAKEFKLLQCRSFSINTDAVVLA